ncbi:NPC intracellular cholesterol transporter 2-like isoform X1 [Hemitrygon akajei]|uniref:NPC intracellular cholesterol transporter 2-like isoform X1 n=1 Tax=Hemitrygon akajei TaxID=2704970 RepID=UPI003BF9B293
MLLAALCAAQPVKFKDCGSTSGKILIVDITPCPSLPCVLRKGKSYVVNVTFASSSKSGNLTMVDITPCPSMPCQLYKGKTYGVNVTFVSLTATNTSKALVHGILSGIPLPFHLPNEDGCKSGIQCPIRIDQRYNYINSLEIKKEYPSVKLVVKWELKDENDRDIFCWEIPVEISS